LQVDVNEVARRAELTGHLNAPSRRYSCDCSLIDNPLKAATPAESEVAAGVSSPNVSMENNAT
jgi:hypothetical protein